MKRGRADGSALASGPGSGVRAKSRLRSYSARGARGGTGLTQELLPARRQGEIPSRNHAARVLSDGDARGRARPVVRWKRSKEPRRGRPCVHRGALLQRGGALRLRGLRGVPRGRARRALPPRRRRQQRRDAGGARGAGEEASRSRADPAARAEPGQGRGGAARDGPGDGVGRLRLRRILGRRSRHAALGDRGVRRHLPPPAADRHRLRRTRRAARRRIVRRASRHYFGRVFATAASTVLALPVYDTQCGAKLLRNTPLCRSLFAQPFGSRWIFDVELLARYLKAKEKAGPLGVYELPLDEWTDVDGSKVRAKDFARAVGEMVAIHRTYRLPGPWRLPLNLATHPFLRYLAVGAIGTSIHYATLIALVEGARASPTLGSTAGALLGALTNYVLELPPHLRQQAAAPDHHAALPDRRGARRRAQRAGDEDGHRAGARALLAGAAARVGRCWRWASSSIASGRSTSRESGSAREAPTVERRCDPSARKPTVGVGWRDRAGNWRSLAQLRRMKAMRPRKGDPRHDACGRWVRAPRCQRASCQDGAAARHVALALDAAQAAGARGLLRGHRLAARRRRLSAATGHRAASPSSGSRW